LPNLKFVSLAVLELLTFNTHNLRGNVTLATPPFRKKIRRHNGIFPASMRVKLEVRTFSSY